MKRCGSSKTRRITCSPSLAARQPPLFLKTDSIGGGIFRCDLDRSESFNLEETELRGFVNKINRYIGRRHQQ